MQYLKTVGDAKLWFQFTLTGAGDMQAIQCTGALSSWLANKNQKKVARVPRGGWVSKAPLVYPAGKNISGTAVKWNQLF